MRQDRKIARSSSIGDWFQIRSMGCMVATMDALPRMAEARFGATGSTQTHRRFMTKIKLTSSVDLGTSKSVRLIDPDTE